MEASWLQAMVAAHGKVQSLRVGIPATFDFADAAPIDVRGISVLFVAGDDTAFAADALRHVEVKAILFAKIQWTLRYAGQMRGSSAVRSFTAGTEPWCQNKGRALLFGSL